MRPWTLLCVLVALSADVAAVALLLAGYDLAIPVAVIGSAAAVTAAAGVLLLFNPKRVARVVVPETPAPLSAAAPEPAAPPPVAAPDPPTPPAAALESPDGEPLDNRPWLKLVEESVALFDELDRHRADFDAPRQEV